MDDNKAVLAWEGEGSKDDNRMTVNQPTQSGPTTMMSQPTHSQLCKPGKVWRESVLFSENVTDPLGTRDC